MGTGKVKWFSNAKGYGFILDDENGGDIFVHYSDISGDGFRTLQPEEMVQYELTDSDKGPKAVNVTKQN